MFQFPLFVALRGGALGAFSAVLLLVGVAAAHAQETATRSSAKLGRIEFNHPSAAKKYVEINLSPDMFGDLFGIGDAALAGVVDALSQSPQATEGSAAIQQAAAQAAATRELVAIAKNVIKSVRVRAYDGLENEVEEQANVRSHYDQQLQTGGWENAIQAQDGDKRVQVSAIRGDDSIKGLFIVASEGNNLVLVNVICDISPENAKLLTTSAVKAGLKAGLADKIEQAMNQKH